MDKIMQQDIIKTYKSIHYSIESAVNSMLSDNDLTASQSHALMFILASGGDVTASEIHRRLGISRPTVSGLIKKLRSKGYVTVEGDESDERLKHIIATDKAGLRREEICSCMSRWTALPSPPIAIILRMAGVVRSSESFALPSR